MRISFASLVGLEPIPLGHLLKRVSDMDVDGIELNCGPRFPRIAGADFGGHLDVHAVVANGAGPVDEQFAGSGIRVTALAPMLNLLTADRSLREAHIEYFRTVIDAAAILGVRAVVTYGGSPFGMWFEGLPAVHQPHPSNHMAESIAAFAEVFTPLAAHAEDRGVKIALETAPRGGGEGNVAYSPALWDQLFEAVPSPALGLSLDPSHLVWLQIRDVTGVIRQYAPRIHHFDGKDAEILEAQLARQGILGNSWWRYRLPGLGALDWSAIFSTLREIGYDYSIAVEQEDPVVPGFDGLAWTARYLRSHLLPPLNLPANAGDTP
jgi:sugar phosphate isomerase/epimerase